MTENFEKWNVKRVSNISVLNLLLLTFSKLIIVPIFVIFNQYGSLSSSILSVFDFLDMGTRAMVNHEQMLHVALLVFHKELARLEVRLLVGCTTVSVALRVYQLATKTGSVVNMAEVPNMSLNLAVYVELILEGSWTHDLQ